MNKTPTNTCKYCGHTPLCDATNMGYPCDCLCHKIANQSPLLCARLLEIRSVVDQCIKDLHDRIPELGDRSLPYN